MDECHLNVGQIKAKDKNESVQFTITSPEGNYNYPDSRLHIPTPFIIHNLPLESYITLFQPARREERQ